LGLKHSDHSSYADDVEVPSFQRRAKCGKCGGKQVDVRPNWKEMLVMGKYDFLDCPGITDRLSGHSLFGQVITD
jgi:hypothetical protein